VNVLLAFLPRLTLKQYIFLTIPLALLGGGGVATVAVLVVLAAYGGAITPAPAQPIPFDHTIHAGTGPNQAGIACEFCHRGVTEQAQATLPSVQQCMFCHNVVGKDRPGVDLLLAHAETGQAINWVRVHRTPDHVRFVHDPHIRAGLDCATCHGDVAAMTQVKQVRSLNMGDCQACHRASSVSIDCATCHK